MNIEIGLASKSDVAKALPFIKEIIAVGETYALPRNMGDEDIGEYFFRKGNQVFKATLGGEVVGICYLRPNQDGGGQHVANAGFMVSQSCRGKGVARSMAEYVIKTAKNSGFSAMQFNFVVSTNVIAVKLWKSLGFKIVGKIPEAFEHPAKGKVDTFVMHRFL